MPLFDELKVFAYIFPETDDDDNLFTYGFLFLHCVVFGTFCISASYCFDANNALNDPSTNVPMRDDVGGVFDDGISCAFLVDFHENSQIDNVQRRSYFLTLNNIQSNKI